MPTTRREMQIHLCDGCGRQAFTEMGTPAEGYHISVLKTNDEYTITAEVFACSAICLSLAIEGALYRNTLDKAEYEGAIRTLQVKGESYKTGVNQIPVYNEANHRQIIGTAEVSEHHVARPTPRPK